MEDKVSLLNLSSHIFNLITQRCYCVIRPRGYRMSQQSMNFTLLINLKLLINANSFLLNMAAHENVSANT